MWRRVLALALTLATAPLAVAEGYTEPAIIYRLTVVRAEGIMLDGNFGNPGRCTVADRLFVRSDHPQYRLLADMLVRARLQGNAVSAYVFECQQLPWFGGPGVTFNVVTSDTAVSLH